MKITKQMLKQIIEEELSQNLHERDGGPTAGRAPTATNHGADPNSDPWGEAGRYAPVEEANPELTKRLTALEGKVDQLMSHVINMSIIS